MAKKKGLDAISTATTALWLKVNEKFGEHAYNLCVNGLDQVVLCKGYSDELAKGNRNVQHVLRELLGSKEEMAK